MANTQGNRELALKFWQSMDDDDKDAMINRAEQMVEAGRFKIDNGKQVAVLVPTYRKVLTLKKYKEKKYYQTKKILQTV